MKKLISFKLLMFAVLLPMLMTNQYGAPLTNVQKWDWIGTSIPEMYGSKAYPVQIGNALIDNGYNIKMVNQSLGSSRIMWNGTDQRSLSATKSELETKFPGNGKNSFQTKIIDEDPDVLIIDQGYNDKADLPDHLGDINSTDRSTFYGAYNYVLKAAYAKNPDLRVAFIIPANNAQWNNPSVGKELNAVHDAIIKIAERYGCIVVDLMHIMGYNDYTYGSTDNPRLTKDGRHMTQATANYAAAILYEKLRFLAFDFHNPPISMIYSFKYKFSLS